MSAKVVLVVGSWHLRWPHWQHRRTTACIVSTEDLLSVCDMPCSGRVIKAALAAGFYPALLRVDHPPARFRATEGGSVQVCCGLGF